MILYAVWKGRITQVYAEKQRTDFRILDENAYLIQQKGSWSVRLPYTLKRFRKPGDTKNIMHVISRADGSYADLYFIPCDENWKRFDRLQPQNPTMQPIIASNVTILGRVISSIRYY